MIPGGRASALPPQARLLLAACRFRHESDDDVRRLLGPHIDWQSVLRLATNEKLGSALARGMGPVAADVPADVAAAIRRIEWLSQLQSVGFEAATRDILRAFAVHGIPVILLKGAALGLTVYDAPHDRPMNDLDLLLPREDARRGWELLRAEGWKLEQPIGLDPFYEEHAHLPPLVSPAGPSCVVEIHRALAGSTGIPDVPEAELWQAAPTVSVGSEPARVLAPHHQLFHLCIHYAWSHAMLRGLGRLARDCQLLLQADGFPWDDFVDLALRQRAAPLCFWALDLAGAVADVPVPVQVLERLRAAANLRGVAALRRLLLASAFPLEQAQLPSIDARKLLWQAAVRPRRLGIGPHRPWHAADRHFAATSSPPASPQRSLHRLARVSGRMPAWLAYAARVLGVASG
jgi:hypothetical protein